MYTNAMKIINGQIRQISYLSVQYVHNCGSLPSCQLPASACVDTKSHVGSQPSIVGSYETLLALFYVHMYVLYIYLSKADKLVPDIVLLVLSKRKSRKRRSYVVHRYLSMRVLQKNNEYLIQRVSHCYRLSFKVQ